MSLDEIGSTHQFLQSLAAVAGNVLEWYDFAVFGFFSDIIGDVFFPHQAGHLQTVESFAVFGGAFLMRPVGGVLMGYIGDVHGRKEALVISIFLMAFPTFVMGCLPSYERAGPIAIVLLIVTRLLQGVSVGGQLMASLVFTLERNDPARWGLYGSFVLAAANFGTLLGNLMAFVLTASLTDQQLHAWGWRLPFWSGILVSLSGFYLRSAGGHDVGSSLRCQPRETPCSTVPEATPEPTESADHDNGNMDGDDNVNGSIVDIVGEQRTKNANPLRIAFSRKNRRALAAATMVPMLWSGGFYLSFVWMATYMEKLIETPVPHSFLVNATALLLSVCMFFPMAGSLSDRYGRVPVMMIGGISLGISSPLLLLLIGVGNSWLALVAQITLGIALSLFGAPLLAWLAESFEPEARLTCK
jgi:MFS transporter, MHS family, proline/betaine transporter